MLGQADEREQPYLSGMCVDAKETKQSALDDGSGCVGRRNSEQERRPWRIVLAFRAAWRMIGLEAWFLQGCATGGPNPDPEQLWLGPSDRIKTALLLLLDFNEHGADPSLPSF